MAPSSHRLPEPVGAAPPGETPATVKDPVCGMNVTPGKAKGGSATHEGHEYWFCNPTCRETFVADPAKYIAPPAPPTPVKAAEAEAMYTCPMHPEIRQRGPGNCPKCGMALEPEMPSLEEGANPELVDMTRRFWISAAMTLPLLVLAMGEVVGFAPLSPQVRSWVELVQLLRERLNLALAGVPAHIDVAKVKAFLKARPTGCAQAPAAAV